MIVALPSPEVVALLTTAHGRDVDVSAVRASYEDGSASLLGWVQDGRVVAVVDYAAMDSATVRIRAITTDQAWQRSDLSGGNFCRRRRLRHRRPRVEAETDEDAVGFYVACGFSVTALGEKHPGVNRYRVELERNA